jgi:hypothetical protein
LHHDFDLIAEFPGSSRQTLYIPIDDGAAQPRIPNVVPVPPALHAALPARAVGSAPPVLTQMRDQTHEHVVPSHQQHAAASIARCRICTRQWC